MYTGVIADDAVIADEDLWVEMFNLVQFSLQITPINLLSCMYVYVRVCTCMYVYTTQILMLKEKQKRI